jgi:hypothetical protein
MRQQWSSLHTDTRISGEICGRRKLVSQDEMLNFLAIQLALGKQGAG